MSEFEKNKYLKDKRNFGSFIIGMLTIPLIEYIGLILLTNTNIIEYPNIYIGYFPIIFTIIIQFLASKLINDTIVPDKFLTKGILMMFLLLVCEKILIPLLLNFSIIEDKSSFAWYMFIIYISPAFIYTFSSLIFYYFKKLVLKIKLMMYYDSLYCKELLEKEKNENKEENKEENKLINNLENNQEEQTKDIFDISGSFVKKLSNKLEENIKK